MTLRQASVALLITAALLLGIAAAGGARSSTAPPSNLWDSMIWDHGSWG